MKEPFSYLVDAQLSAMLGSILVFILIVRWYMIPKLKYLNVAPGSNGSTIDVGLFKIAK